jgi:GNAT superfamily N-acetyltransferase
MSDLLARAYETELAWTALGHELRRGKHFVFVREPRAPAVYDANFAALPRAETPAEVDAAIAELEAEFAATEHRQVFWDPATSLPFEARLQLDDYVAHDELVLVLEGALSARRTDVEIRPALRDADWDAITELCWQDHQEEVKKGFHGAWPRSITEQVVACKRWKAPAVRFFVARVDGVDCGFFSGFPGENGVGMVEDLYTRDDFRGRGVASALIAACVDHARARGAGPVLIGARPDDTPKQMYAAMGFRPLCVKRAYLRVPPGSPLRPDSAAAPA